MAERLYGLTEKGKKMLKQLEYNRKEERVNMVSLVKSILMINHENNSSHNSSKDEKGRS